MDSIPNLRNFVIAQRRSRNLQGPKRSRSNSLPGLHFEATGSKVRTTYQAHSPLLDELECSICKEDFGDGHNKQPRTIPCGHTFCTSCIESLLLCPKKTSEGKSKKCCPICRISIKAQNVSEVPVSFTILNIILQLRQHKSRPDRSQQQCSMQSIGFCENHNSPKQFWCKSCSMWLCGACALLKHKEENGEKCELTTVDEAILVKKAEHERELEKLEETHIIVAKSISDAIDICQTSKKLIKSNVAILEQRLKEAKLRFKSFEAIQDKMREMSSAVDEEWFQSVSISNEVKLAQEYSQLDNSVIRFQSLQFCFLQREFFIQLPYQIWSKMLLIECLLQHPNKIFYGEDYDDNINRWLKVSLRWPALCLHSGDIERPPSGAIVFHIDDVIEKAHTFFLDLCYASDVDIRMKVQITDSSEFLPVFMGCCLGRKGKFFRGSKFVALEVDEETDSIILWMGCQIEQRRDSLASLEADSTTDKKCLIEELSSDKLTNRERICSQSDNESERNSSAIASSPSDASEHSSRSDASNSSGNSFSPDNGSRRASHSSTIALPLPTEVNKLQSGQLKRVRSKVVHPAGSLFVKVLDANSGEIQQNSQHQFGILINEAVITDTNYIDVGSVISGDFKFLTENLQEDNVKQLIIKDCGLQIEATSETLYNT